MQIAVHIRHIEEIDEQVLAMPDYFIDRGALQSRIEAAVKLMDFIVAEIIEDGWKVFVKCRDQLIIAELRGILKHTGEPVCILILPHDYHVDLVASSLAGGKDDGAEHQMPYADGYHSKDALIQVKMARKAVEQYVHRGGKHSQGNHALIDNAHDLLLPVVAPVVQPHRYKHHCDDESDDEEIQ